MRLSVRPASLHHDVMHIHCPVLLRLSMKPFLLATDRIVETLAVAQGLG